MAPMASLEKMEPDTDATAALSMSALSKLRLSPMIGTNDAATKVETKHVMEIHGRWKERKCELAKEKRLKDLALFLSSSLTVNLLIAAFPCSPASTSIFSSPFL